jgi:hypothetical protein
MLRLHFTLYRYFRLIFISSLLMLATGLAAEQEEVREQNDVLIRDAWIRSVLPVQKTTALYMTITNNSDKPLTLVDVQSNIAAHTMMHRTEQENGIAKMRHQHSVVVAPGDTVAFQPGGLHVMLMGLNRPVNKGDRVKVTLVLEDGRRVDFEAVVQA